MKDHLEIITTGVYFVSCKQLLPDDTPYLMNVCKSLASWKNGFRNAADDIFNGRIYEMKY